MRERIAQRELPFVLASFRKADDGLSGLIDRDRFRSLLKRLDFGVSNVDDKVRLRGESREGGSHGEDADWTSKSGWRGEGLDGLYCEVDEKNFLLQFMYACSDVGHAVKPSFPSGS